MVVLGSSSIGQRERERGGSRSVGSWGLRKRGDYGSVGDAEARGLR